MKISIERGTLLKAVGQAQSVVERRNTIPILANVLIEAEGANVSFRATVPPPAITDNHRHGKIGEARLPFGAPQAAKAASHAATN